MDELLGRIGSIDINLLLDQSIEESKDFLLDLIRSQLLKGERSDGSPIGTYSSSKLSKYYVEIKYDMGLFQGDSFPNYDLYFDGTLYRSIIATVNGDNIEVTITDSKLSDVEENTGNLDNALELNEENLELYRQHLLPILQNKINGHIGI